MTQNILLLDDDQSALNHLRRLVDWEKLGYGSPVLCTSFLQARQTIEKQVPDVCILDIEVPGGNGLEFAAELRREHRNIIVLMLTAFREFRYAQQAVAVGALDYLIKSELTTEILSARLLQIRDMLDNRARNRQLMRETLLCMLLSDETPQKQRNECYELLSITKHALALLRVQCTNTLRGCPPLPETEAAVVVRYAQSRNWVCLRKGDSLWVLLEQENLDDLRVAIGNAKQTLQPQLNEAGFVFSAPFTDVQKVGEVYRWFALTDNERFFCSFLRQPQNFFSPVGVEVDFRPLWAALQHADRPTFMEELHKIIAALPRARERMQKTIELCDQLGEKLDYAPLPCNARCLQDVENWCVDQFDIALKQRAELHGATPLTRDIASLIRQNPSISQCELADRLNRSVGYLRAVFKRDMHMTIADYLLKYRIEKAKQLLSSHRVKVLEVAERLGFQSPQYFSVVFRKATGLTPSEFERNEDR